MSEILGNLNECLTFFIEATNSHATSTHGNECRESPKKQGGSMWSRPEANLQEGEIVLLDQNLSSALCAVREGLTDDVDALLRLVQAMSCY